MEARFRVSLQGGNELTDFFSKSERGAKSFSSNIGKALADAGKQVAGFALATGKSLASLALGDVGIASTAKKVLDFRDSLMDLAIQAKLSDSELGGLTTQIHAVAKASNQMQDDVTEALSAFVAKTGDIDAARKNLELFGKVATATGAQIKDVALVGVELSDKLKIKDPAEMARAMGILTAQGRMGAVEIKDLATKAPKIFSAASAMFGVKGEEGLRGTGAMAQVFAKAFGGGATPANVATAMNTAFTDVLKSQSVIEKAGIKVKGRDPYEVIKDIVAKAGGDPQQLLKNKGHGIFEMRSLAGVNVLAEEFRRTKGFATFDAFKNAAPNDLDAEVARRMSTGAQKLKATQISVAASAEKNLGDKFDYLAGKANLLGKGFEWITSHLAMSAAGAVTGLAMFNVAKGVIPQLFGGGKGGGGGILGLGGGVQKVFVVNMGAGMGGGLPGGAGKAGSLRAALGVGAVAVGAGLWAIDKFEGAGDANIKARYAAGIEENNHRIMLGKQKAERDIRVREFEKQGMTHGQALYAADQVKIDKLSVNVKIDKNGNTSAEVNGTRSPEAMVNRGAEDAGYWDSF